MDIYTTKLGDTWDLIAFRVYGKEKYKIELQKANPQFLDEIIFQSGVKLVCPDIPVPTSDILPPWKRGG